MLKHIFELLQPTTPKTKIVNYATTMFEEVSETVLPSLELNDNVIKDSDAYIALNAAMKKYTPGYRGNLVKFSFDAFEARFKERDHFLEIIESTFGDRLNRESIAYDEVILMQFISLFNFSFLYARRFMLVATKQKIADAYNPVLKHELDFVNSRENMEAFAVTMGIINTKFKDFSKKTTELKGITYSPEVARLVERSMGTVVDATKVNFLPTYFHPVYLIGQVANLYETHIYKRAREEAARLRSQVYYLEQEVADASPEELAKIKKQIDYHNKRLDKLDQMIEEIEQDAEN